jgi:hypothetical protein
MSIQFVLNTLVSAMIIATATYMAQKFTFFAALLVALPLTSILTLIFLYLKTGDVGSVSQMSLSIFWLVLPTFGFFLLLPLLLKWGFGFWLSLGVSCSIFAAFYPGYRWALEYLGIRL